MEGDSQVTRRQFVATASALAAGVMIVPRHVLGGVGHRAPSARVNVAIVGVGGMGMNNMAALADENVVAVCDIDWPFVERSLAGRLRPNREGVVAPEAIRARDALAKAKRYTDYREMLARHRDLDAVVVATPDHLHAPIAVAAMRAGKHVYVQKPLTYSVHEARVLARVAAEKKVVTQMGNQGHSFEGTRRIREIVASGVLGPIRDVHVWTDRPVRHWAQGIPRPRNATPTPVTPPTPAAGAPAPTTATPAPATPAGPPPPPRWNMRTVDNAVLKAMDENPQAIPAGLDWDLFLGPAPAIPYHPAYHPFSWRGWLDFGVGAIGDMGAHLIDQPFWALDLGYPTTISATSSPWGGSADNPATYPMAMMAQFGYPARGQRPPLTLSWYDGGLMPPRPPHLPDAETLPRGDGGGGVFIGERGILTYETYGNNPKVYPESLAAEAAAVPTTVPRIAVPHEVNWVQAIRKEAAPSCPFDYAAPLTETMLLGIAALRAGQGRLLRYDGAAMRFTNAPDADKYLTRVYRDGWAVA